MQKQRLKISRQDKERYGKIRHLDQVQRLDPIDFEHFIGYLYQKQGYRVFTTVTSGDEGIDLYLERNGISAIVQCKRYGGTVGQPVIRDLYGSMIHTGSQEAMIVTSGRISAPAEQWAAGKPIQLIDRYELMSWIRRERTPDYDVAGGSFLSRIPWTSVGIVGVLAISAVLIAGAIFLAVSTFSDRTRTDLPPAPTLAVGGTDSGGVPLATPEPANPTPTLVPATQPTFTPVSPLGDQSSSVTARRLTTAPNIDGDPREWAGGTPIRSPHIVEQESSWDGSLDVEATWQLGWDDSFLYIGVVVEDNRIVQTEERDRAYLGDSIEIQLDVDLNGDAGETTSSSDDFQYILSPGNFVNLDPSAFRFRGNGSVPVDAPGTGTRIDALQIAGGYALEAAIPWTDLSLAPRSGLTIGAALSINDNDSPGTAVQELMLSHVATRRWNNPTTWGRMTLE